MFFARALRSKLVSLLRPWLEDDPELELELGFLRSTGIAKNLSFDPSRFNPSIKETTLLEFTRVTVGELRIRISPWSSPSLIVEVRGVNVTLAPRESDDAPHAARRDLDAQKRKKAMASIDPTGSSLHEIIERVSTGASSDNRLVKFLVDAMIRCCQIQLHDIHVHLQFTQSLACPLEVGGISLEPLLVDRNSLCRGLFGSLFSYRKDIILAISCNRADFGLNENEHINCITSFTSLSACVRLSNLQLQQYGIKVSHLYFKISPLTVPILLAVLAVFTFKRSESVRNGQELWNIAVKRMGYSTITSRLAWRRLGNLVVLWSRYIRAYESLLLLVGYSPDNTIKEHFMRLSSDSKLMSRVKHQWGIIHELEESLPAEAVARARRVARYRALLHSDCVDLKSPTGPVITALLKILSPVLFLWNVICLMFQSAVRSSFMWNYMSFHQGISRSCMLSLPSASGDPTSQYFSLNLEELYISFAHVTTDDASNNREGKHGTNLAPIHPFCLCVKSSCFIYALDGNSESFLVASGELKLLLSPSLDMSTMVNDVEAKRSSSLKGPKLDASVEEKVILWIDPAMLYQPSEVDINASLIPNESAPILVLKNSIEDLWSTWKTICGQSEDMNMQLKEHPFVLCEIKNFTVDPYLVRGDYGLSKCNFSLGKLNFDLDYPSILSAILLFRRIEEYHLWTNRIGGIDSLECSSSILEESTETKGLDKIKLYTNGVKATMVNMIPDKNIQVGALITGLSIQLSLPCEQWSGSSKQNFIHSDSQENNFFCCGLDLENIECIVWPTAKSILAALTGEQRFSEASADYLWLNEPQTIDIPKSHINGSFLSQGRVAVDAFLKCNGLVAFVDDLDLNQQYHVIELMPLVIRSSSCGDYLHSLHPTLNFLSVSLSISTTGAAVLLHMDDLWTLLQVFKGVLSRALSVSVNFGLSEDLVRKLISFSKKHIRTNKIECGPTDGNMTTESNQVLVDASLQLEQIVIVINDSRNFHGTQSSEKTRSAFSRSSFSRIMSPGDVETTTPGLLDIQSFGIAVFIQRSCFQISSEEDHAHVLIDFSEIQSDIFNSQSWFGVCTDLFQIKRLINQTSDHLYQFSLSSCIFSLQVGFKGYTSLPKSSKKVHDGSISGNREILNEAEWLSSNLQMDHILSSSAPGLASGLWIVAETRLSGIFIGECSMKNLVKEAHKFNGLRVLVLMSGELDIIRCNIKGGFVFLETAALAMFIHCYKVYFLLITSCTQLPFKAYDESSRETRIIIRPAETATERTNESNDQYEKNAVSATPISELQRASEKNSINMLTVELSQFQLILAVTDGSGGAQEIILEADMNLELINFGRKMSFDLSRLTIFTQKLDKSPLNQTRDSTMPRFRSIATGPLSPYNSSGSHARLEQVAHSMSEDVLVDQSSEVSPFCGSYILKHATSSLIVEKMVVGCQVPFVRLKSNWSGSGTMSGFDLTIKLSEIQMLSDLIAPLSGMSTVEASQILEQTIEPMDPGRANNPDFTIADGAIVAIEDLHQHMYFAVEGVDRSYRIIGSLHYSLHAERSLFRVRYHKRWGSQVSWISFISMFAKDEDGTPLRLNCSPGSGFVEISSSNDKNWALWQTFPYKSDIYEDDGDDGDVNSYRMYSQKAFHLVNKKNGCGIAFIDGLPEFVMRPGNPLKVKVFNEFSLMGIEKSVDFNKTSYEINDTNVPEPFCSEGDISEHSCSSPHINIVIEKIVLTILHEASDTNDEFPLIQGCINNIYVTAQLLSSKFRIISSFDVAMHYFDPQRDLWRELIAPFNSCLFYRSRFIQHGSTDVYQGVPIHFYLRMSQVDIYLTEISLDVLLFLAGKLDIFGPYSVRSSSIFPNCVKIENHSGLSLVCHFTDSQDVKIAGKQSSSIFLRHILLGDQHQNSGSLASISLTEGHFSTSPINISLANAHVFAWRTRAVSLQDTRSFPGPFIVVEVLKNAEEGMSLVVSPLLRIKNESGFPLKLRFRRPHEPEKESASILLDHGDTIDDSVAVFDALDLSGGSRRALMSITLGNFLLSVRPEVTESIRKNGESILMDWSEDLKGGKAVRVAGIFDKLNYKFRKAFGVGSEKCFFSSLICPFTVDGLHASNLYFLIRTTGRDVPVMRPPNVGDASDSEHSPVAMQLQKEILICPTVHVYNLLQTEISVLLTETNPDICIAQDCDKIGKEAIINCGSSAYFYANPAMMYFTVTLTAYNSKCKPVNSGDWVKKLHKQKSEVHYLDISLEFGSRKYYVSLRLSLADKGILEVTVFTTYTLQNDTEHFLLCSSSNQKHISWEESEIYNSNLPPELGSLLPPNSIRTWFLKSNKVNLKLMQEKSSQALLDLDIISGFTELSLQSKDEHGINLVLKLGVLLQPCMHKYPVPSQVVCLVPRYVISNESKECISVRQCYHEDDIDRITSIGGEQKVALQVLSNTRKRMQASIFDSVLKRHRDGNMDSETFVQFCPDEKEYSWSGPICVASLGRFFLKLRRPSSTLSNQANAISLNKGKSIQFAAVNITEESASLVLHFYMPPHVALPYRIENCLNRFSVMYQQKESVETDILSSGDSVEYVWDDLNLPHKLMVHILDIHQLREINIDKISAWKPFFKTRQTKGMYFHLPYKIYGDEKETNQSFGPELFKVGYEVYADGLTRVLRICEHSASYKGEKILLQPSMKAEFRMSNFGLHFLENNKQDINANDATIYSTIIVARMTNITLDSLIMENYKHNWLRVQSFSVDEKWDGAPFASMVRRSEVHDIFNDNILHIIFILQSANSNVKQVKYSSIILQPINLKVDEETLMRLVPFWRTSLSESTTQSRQFYFKHFEIHPIKITASFLPGSPYSSYSSAQETLRSLLHSIIKVPPINNTIVELNGVLLTHALLAFRELLIKCVQHYSWYIVRAIYKTKGSLLLPPGFASIFDDTASSSLDVYFDPSDGSINLPGVTLGMFKFISKCINSKGFSGTKRYFGDLGKTIKTASSIALFAAVTEISDSILKGAETSGFNGMAIGFHQGILRLAMEPSLLGAAVMEGGPDRRIKLDRSPGIDELYIEGYLQAMLDVTYKQEYLRVRVIDNQVVLKNLPPNSSVINEIVEDVKSFLVSKALLKGDSSIVSRPLRHLRSESEWKIGPTVLTLCEHLFVGFAIRMLRKQSNKFIVGVRWKGKALGNKDEEGKGTNSRMWIVGKFVLSGMVAYLDGRLCRHIPNPIARRIVSGFMLSFLDNKKQNG